MQLSTLIAPSAKEFFRVFREKFVPSIADFQRHRRYRYSFTRPGDNGIKITGYLVRHLPCPHNVRFAVQRIPEPSFGLEWTMLHSEMHLMAPWLADWVLARFDKTLFDALPPPPISHTDRDGGHDYRTTFYAWTVPAWDHQECCPEVRKWAR